MMMILSWLQKRSGKTIARFCCFHLCSVLVFLCFGFYYTGYFASSGISIRTSHFMPEFQSRFSIFGYIIFFQSGFSLSGSVILMSTFEFIYKIYFYLKGVKDAEQSQ